MKQLCISSISFKTEPSFLLELSLKTMGHRFLFFLFMSILFAGKVHTTIYVCLTKTMAHVCVKRACLCERDSCSTFFSQKHPFLIQS